MEGKEGKLFVQHSEFFLTVARFNIWHREVTWGMVRIEVNGVCVSGCGTRKAAYARLGRKLKFSEFQQIF